MSTVHPRVAKLGQGSPRAVVYLGLGLSAALVVIGTFLIAPIALTSLLIGKRICHRHDS